MQAIRTLIWVIVAVIITVFAVANAQPVTVSVWPGSVAELPLSILIILVFLLGFLPPFLLNLGNRWRLSRKINQQEQVIAQLRPTTVVAPASPASATPSTLSTDGTTS
ncbi:DUF1049 domain-containing protein [Sphingomonas lacunae]|uniref:DUF1049 domain-containing protein n=1 Tax=Sphingomonas lacunae TaxID=2698828 RepID=A0A6M4AUM8_9SPHN|nr:LapA family protein [Sphingomonas lacunae]QJQ32847.1 DUF1049 domain-containing protein [Sphingomonas lacunae]